MAMVNDRVPDLIIEYVAEAEPYRRPPSKRKPRPKSDPATRLLAQRRLVPCPSLGSDCWESTHKPDAKGYCHISINGKTELVHRAAYKTWKRPIPDGYTIDHLCVNPPCFNPEHLECVTNDENIRRMHERTSRRMRWEHDNIILLECGYRINRALRLENDPDTRNDYLSETINEANGIEYERETIHQSEHYYLDVWVNDDLRNYSYLLEWFPMPRTPRRMWETIIKHKLIYRLWPKRYVTYWDRMIKEDLEVIELGERVRNEFYRAGASRVRRTYVEWLIKGIYGTEDYYSVPRRKRVMTTYNSAYQTALRKMKADTSL